MNDANRSRLTKLMRPLLRKHEALILVYATDCTACGCVDSMATGATGVDAVSVARGEADWFTYDRCLKCGTAWKAREYRSDPLEVVPDPGRALSCGPDVFPLSRSAKIRRAVRNGEDIRDVARQYGVVPSDVNLMAKRGKMKAA